MLSRFDRIVHLALLCHLRHDKKSWYSSNYCPDIALASTSSSALPAVYAFRFAWIYFPDPSFVVRETVTSSIYVFSSPLYDIVPHVFRMDTMQQYLLKCAGVNDAYVLLITMKEARDRMVQNRRKGTEDVSALERGSVKQQKGYRSDRVRRSQRSSVLDWHWLHWCRVYG